MQTYCHRLCNPKYGMPCTECGTVRDSGGKLREGYVCQPCRRARNTLDPSTAGSSTQCILCHKEMTEAQRLAGNKFCGSGCAYRFRQIVDVPAEASKRLRRFGWVRPMDESTGQMFEGPLRRFKLSAHLYERGGYELSCPWCSDRLPMNPESGQAWCGHCAVLVGLDVPPGRDDAA